MSGMKLESDGAEHVSDALSARELSLLGALADHYCDMGAGARICRDTNLSEFLAAGSAMDRIARENLGINAKPVRAILFDKRPELNWALGWHQDRTIAVRKKVEVAGFGAWSVKSGIVHVEPPFSFIEGMVTLRAHLDACGEDNAPLLIVPKSHRLGRVPVNTIKKVVSQNHMATCCAAPGDIWVYASAIVHASRAALRPKHRRVLHVDYTNVGLPGGLEWFGV